MAKNINFDFDLVITEGDDRTFTMTFKDPDGNQVDISAWDFFYTAKSAYADTDDNAVLKLEPVDFTKTGSPVTDKISAVLELGNLADGRYFHDLQKVVAGVTTTLGRGLLVVEPRVTIREA